MTAQVITGVFCQSAIAAKLHEDLKHSFMSLMQVACNVAARHGSGMQEPAINALLVGPEESNEATCSHVHHRVAASTVFSLCFMAGLCAFQLLLVRKGNTSAASRTHGLFEAM